MIEITIPYRLLLLGQLQRMHFAQRTREQRLIAWLVKSALLQQGIRVERPYEKARVTVRRYSTQEPDEENLSASCKLLMDVLQPLSKRHPCGLGIILNDSPAHLERDVRHVHCGRGLHQTDITIERLA